jgi:imidazolonepropionase-like amidohydrolase
VSAVSAAHTYHASALACGKSDELGTIEAGKSADILVVNGNPLDDLHRLRDVRLIIKNGLPILGEETKSA